LDLRQDSIDTAVLFYRRRFPAGEFRSVSQLAHCDGLPRPTNTKAYVFNPATKDAIALPESQRNMMMHDACLPIGFGFGASTGRYKVARSFYRSCCWGDTRKIRITALTQVEFSTRLSTGLGRKDTMKFSASSTSSKKV
jgi:hypothetical protein